MSTYNLGKVVGDNAYELAVKNGYNGNMQEWIESLKLHYADLSDGEIAELQLPATEIAAIVSTAESARATAESARITAENSRVDAESTRSTAENARVAAESARVTAESRRTTAESGRSTEESARSAAESIRSTAESNRSTAESARIAAESARVTAEDARVDAESARVTAESARTTAESGRSTQESARITAENNRNNTIASKIAEINSAIEEIEAPSDGKKYVRSNGGWVIADAKIDLFIDLWINLCALAGNGGGYNATTQFFEVNDLTNITYEQARDIYLSAKTSTSPNLYLMFNGLNIRTIINFGLSNFVNSNTFNIDYTFRNNSAEIININNASKIYIERLCYTFQSCARLKVIKQILINKLGSDYGNLSFAGCSALEFVKIENTKENLGLNDSPLLTNESILHIVTYAAPTTSIILTLHPDAYTRAIADTEIQASLEEQPLITLASA